MCTGSRNDPNDPEITQERPSCGANEPARIAALGQEEGDPEELLEDPTFEARLQKRLVEISRRFGIDRRLAARRTVARGGQESPAVPRRG